MATQPELVSAGELARRGAIEWGTAVNDTEVLALVRLDRRLVLREVKILVAPHLEAALRAHASLGDLLRAAELLRNLGLDVAELAP